jgi:MtrB/PioB family decaheme-associated outer membrane protein
VATLGDGSQLSGSFARGRMLQDEILLPYSSAISTTAALPATRVNGRIETLTAALNFSRRLTTRLNLRLNYALDSRDNDTPRYLWLRVPGDSAAQATSTSANAHINLPYGHMRQRLRAEAQLRLQGGRQLQFEYEHTQHERDFTEVEIQREDQVSATLLFALGGTGKGRLELLHARRRNDGYIANAAFIAGHNPDYLATLGGNQLYSDDPLLRRYPLAERDRNQFKAMLNRTLPWRMALTLNGKVSRDAFGETAIGRQSSEAWDISVNLSQQWSSALDWYLWHTRQGYANKQAGYSRTNTQPILPLAARINANNWWMDTHDRIATSGLGWSWRAMNDKVTAKGDLSYSDAGTSHAPLSRGLAYLPFPDVTTRFTTLNFGIDFAAGERGTVGLRYRYEDFASTDIALDAVAVDTLNNVILLGNGSPVYAGSLVQLSYQVRLQ